METTTKAAGRLGGIRRAQRLSKKELSAIGRRGARKRWGARGRGGTRRLRS